MSLCWYGEFHHFSIVQILREFWILSNFWSNFLVIPQSDILSKQSYFDIAISHIFLKNLWINWINVISLIHFPLKSHILSSILWEDCDRIWQTARFQILNNGKKQSHKRSKQFGFNDLFPTWTETKWGQRDPWHYSLWILDSNCGMIYLLLLICYIDKLCLI